MAGSNPVGSPSAGPSEEMSLAPGDVRSAERVRGIDGTSVLTVYLVLLVTVPSGLTLTALGAAGRLATLFGLLALLLWAGYQVQRSEPTGRGRQPVRIAHVVLLTVALASYAVATSRGLVANEASTADTGLLRLASWTGILLVANDWITSQARLVALLRRFVLLAGLLAVLGLAQFYTGNAFVDAISIPGFTLEQLGSSVQARAGFARSAGTAVHPLEYATVLAMAFPVAIALALTERHRSGWSRWFPVAAIAFATILSVSRSALLGALVGLLVLAPGLPPRIRRRGYVALAMAIGAVYVLVPGMLGTIRGLFGGISDDPSTVSRTSSYDAAFEFVARHPWLGRGFGTFLPEYRILDNQYLQLVIELGYLGLLALLALVAVAVGSAVTARRGARDDNAGLVATALAASAASGAVLMAFFDSFSFVMAGSTLFFVLGVCGAARRLQVDGPAQRTTAASAPPSA